MSRTNFNQFIYGRQKGKFAGSKKKKRRIIMENKTCESCVYFDKNTDNQTGMCREFECCVNKNQCCQWYVKRLDK